MIPEPYKEPIFNMVVEIPRDKLAKWECVISEEYHPLRQDTVTSPIDGEGELPRFYPIFPIFNYGYIPQTLEDPDVEVKDGILGDGDPVDVVEITKVSAKIGDVKAVKVIGALPLIDQGEFDCKVLVVDVDSEVRKLKN